MNVLNRVTMKTLRRNRARTVVTIIGVILSAAMFTAVTTFISTMQHYMLASVLSTQGSWHAQLAGLPYDAAGQLRDDPKIKAVAVQQEIGYARLPESQNDYKPYWYIQALDDGSASLLGIRLVEGRMPQNAGELLVPEHVLTSGGVAVKAGDTLTLSVGDRLADDGSPLTQTNPYNEEEPETIRIRETKAYTVVGICSRPSLEPYSAPGFTAFSALDTAALASDSPVILTFEAISGTLPRWPSAMRMPSAHPPRPCTTRCSISAAAAATAPSTRCCTAWAPCSWASSSSDPCP